MSSWLEQQLGGLHPTMWAASLLLSQHDDGATDRLIIDAHKASFRTYPPSLSPLSSPALFPPGPFSHATLPLC